MTWILHPVRVVLLPRPHLVDPVPLSEVLAEIVEQLELEERGAA